MTTHRSTAYVKPIAERGRAWKPDPITAQFRFIVRMAVACHDQQVPYDLAWAVEDRRMRTTITATGKIPTPKALPKPPKPKPVSDWKPAIWDAEYRLDAYHDGTLNRIKSMGVGVHLRSIFLNGLLFLPPDRVPAQLKGASGRLSRARRMIAEGRSDPLQAALGFALSRPEADVVLVGVTTAAELSAVVAAAAHPPPDLDWDEMAIDDPVLDHDRWAAA